ncbi:hypothetical protein SAMN05216189_10087 [Pseudomonas delhiensis]|uniref:Short chain dehydrogenase n=1 Tax=Pseudomonas delhiensis TaxID=366289 RepID=A0A239FND2_9PSED|nr:hypothetical protein [Pseudomonas delhiensis]SDI70680.1 hypothetical protein SAMN05216189_10087 [Pseudomonas delhiensis]SNS58390.1 hypothetical protein SAMN06295949_1047 [Pseudomonas delhiensis]
MDCILVTGAASGIGAASARLFQAMCRSGWLSPPALNRWAMGWLSRE